MLQQARQKIRESSGETVRTPAIQQGIVSRAPQKMIIENRPSIETTDDDDDEDEEFFYEDDEQIDAKDEEEIKMTPKPKEDNKPVILTSNFFLPGKPIPKLEQHHEFENHEPNDLSSGDISETNDQQRDNAEDVIDSLPEEETERFVEKATKKYLAPIATTTTTTTPRTTTTTTAEIAKATSATSPKPVSLDPNVEYEYYDDYVDEPTTTTTQTKTISKPVTEQEEQTTIHVPEQEAEVEEEEDEEVDEDESEPIGEHSTIENIDEPEVTAKTVEKSIKSIPIDEPIETSVEPIETSVEPIETSSVSSTGAIENPSTSTEGYVVVASVQTSRSISGARYLTFPQVEQEEKRQSLSDTQKDVKKLHKDDDYSNENVSDDDSSDSSKADDLVKSTEDKSKKMVTTKDEATTATSNDSTEQTSEENVAQSKHESDTPNVDVVKSRTHKLSSISEKLAHLHELNEPKPEITTKSVPVVIRKFSPRTTTKAPARKLPSITSKKPNFDVDDELASLLPPGFKYRAQSTTPKTEKTTTTEKIDILQKIQFKEISLEDLLPKDYKPPTSDSEPKADENVTKNEQSDILSKTKFDDNIVALLPKDYKPPPSSSTTKAPLRLSTVTEDISKFLPPGFKIPKESIVTTTTPASSTTNRPQSKTTMDDISKFLPPGYRLPKSTTTTTEKPETTTPNNAGSSDEQQSLLNKLSFNTDISSLLPPSFKANTSDDDSVSREKTDEKPSSTTPSSSGGGNSGFKLVFPKGIGKRPGVRLTTPRPSYAEGPTQPGITIRKGLPTR